PGKEKPGRSRVFRGRVDRDAYSGWTSSACRPFWPWTTLKDTFWPSCSDLKPVPWIERKCTNRSAPLSGVMKPKPLASLNHLTVPVWRSDMSLTPWNEVLVYTADAHMAPYRTVEQGVDDA